jgi:hypothetical protein
MTVTWMVCARLLDGNLAIELRDFLKDHGVKFEEGRACGFVELVVRCSKADALRLADALQLLGTRALFAGEDSCLLIVRPGGMK